MSIPRLDGVEQFLLVAELGSFSAAARRLGVSPSAVSQAVRQLEQRLGAALLHRTTRSVSLTEAGSRYLASASSALEALEAANEAVSDLSQKPRGTLRLNVLRGAYLMVLQPILGRFIAAYPEISLEIFIDSGVSDVVREGFDAGIRFGHVVAQDMVGIDVGPRLTAHVLATPAYFRKRGTPKHPRDLKEHECIGFRHPPSGPVEPWEFEKGKERYLLRFEPRLVFNDSAALLQAALDGLGVTYTINGYVERFLEEGKLVRVLASWSPPLDSFRLFYPSRRRVAPKLRALIDFLRAARAPASPNLSTTLREP
ncbi:Transcriptional regulator, LysR family [Labilithrix luteola]|uniref:Transcriptional regulator, LysR family n=1 Tax=Labilithrix luteola TaxID=1391654 RepID=A0A0K1QER9_9BACT|nr:LysR family transcriptional regulator [Labilithrix luteola]AKV04256.1 Transcriptional regulator, LysR family [Labilithrix luteola]